MKISEAWLREWVNPSWDSEVLQTQLTMGGLEVEKMAPLMQKFTGVVVAEVMDVAPHPEADRLKVCQVNVGQEELLTIVCGAKNVRPGIKVPAALVGARLPNKIKINRSKIRNIFSNGMLCSSAELGFSEEGADSGIYELPAEVPLGVDFWDYFNLTDQIIDLSVTPNRGDCLSIMGLAKEVAALSSTPLVVPYVEKNNFSTNTGLFSLEIIQSEGCPHYVGRILRGVNANAVTPIWMQEKLRRSGARCIHPIVDIMNYVMFELGQPMHAFDLQKIVGGIKVRQAHPDETLVLLNNQSVTLNENILIIADDEKPLALAGVMGGLSSAVTSSTQDIFLESAFFNPAFVTRAARHYTLGSESSYRFERGIDPTLQIQAMNRATDLLLMIVGGAAGPIIDRIHIQHLPQPAVINLRIARLNKVLGVAVPALETEAILQRLGFNFHSTETGWQVTVPARRSDVVKEIDLIEEVARLYGYARLPATEPQVALKININSTNKLNLNTLRYNLRDVGYHEVITYSFIDKKTQKMFDPYTLPKELINPIVAEMGVMRTNLWPGLMNVLLFNHNRQQPRVRLFEIGARFLPETQITPHYIQQTVISGLVSGTAYPEQWGEASRTVDFYDLKNDIENILKLTQCYAECEIKVGAHPALHPGQTADIYRKNAYLGTFGLLHPAILQLAELRGPVFVFEMLIEQLAVRPSPSHSLEISKFPEIRRDIAIFVDVTVPVQLIQDIIKEVGGELLKQVVVFDVYSSKSEASRKSIALALTLQHSSRTLVDAEVVEIVERILLALKQKVAAELRG